MLQVYVFNGVIAMPGNYKVLIKINCILVLSAAALKGLSRGESVLHAKQGQALRFCGGAGYSSFLRV